MDLKTGDTVEVINGSGYRHCRTGSKGTVTRITSGHVYADWYSITGEPFPNSNISRIIPKDNLEKINGGDKMSLWEDLMRQKLEKLDDIKSLERDRKDSERKMEDIDRKIGDKKTKISEIDSALVTAEKFKEGKK